MAACHRSLASPPNNQFSRRRPRGLHPKSDIEGGGRLQRVVWFKKAADAAEVSVSACVA
jgi:hypothetical protein